MQLKSISKSRQQFYFPSVTLLEFLGRFFRSQLPCDNRAGRVFPLWKVLRGREDARRGAGEQSPGSAPLVCRRLHSLCHWGRSSTTHWLFCRRRLRRDNTVDVFSERRERLRLDSDGLGVARKTGATFRGPAVATGSTALAGVGLGV